jgi:16S rRNA (cytosine967-C5)-methyltransferase
MSSLKAVSSQKPRQIAVRVLNQRRAGQEYTENLLEKELSNHRLTTSDRGLIQEIVYGIARNEATLDWLISRKTEGRAQKEELRTLLHLGLYQMFWLDRVPNHAAVHETVEIAKELGMGPQAGFVNAVLRAYTRERVETEKLLLDLKTEKPALGYSHPEWLQQRWAARWGDEKTAELMKWNNTPPPTFARTNTLKGDAVGLAEYLTAERVNFTAREFDWCEPGMVHELTSHPSLAALRSFTEGRFYVQDPSTLLAVKVLDPKPAEAILDLCAAPGGKATYIAQLMQNRGRITAQDNVPERLDLIRENCVRLGVTIVEASVAPTGIIPNPSKKFDRILVDAPCSNTGVMRRRVDLRWRIAADEIERLRVQQLELLHQAAPRLKPGGTLVYSTCSLEPEENSELIKQFLAANAHFKLVSERELIPFVDGVDGAYVAKLTSVPPAAV